ncbi:poly-beta-1,6-N-acetyl-D-glucosamine synthase [Mammaliicoccus fleurettii]|uniref:Poly-beta-1,6-N-acetyl-D-glucosamine synthase n=1 Tax=Mammaliicoccus fleurettii TaxID=150056 RepID=A0ABS5MPC2_9STAP|nr:poly-beta-1,6-N-acetyl-D-glucosamine synthase [Mammaliicoccus fleurettii]MBL0848013.1 poly-beta-1,6 N-acetyl-D-glucosamine synthase [Mammaliicoccus fleurettii]MBO3061377.1 poly-beta-1,6 N-acetyl-D-glucosamine synthase [Mammaliicoccus fleurettii]MBS3672771.1 poly-beta-1,6 N-acetyl-D-glucosamine synthase [Mammaliicoccus fleurettii]MBS3697768.1 poly-beta-1,6 N-acetyl-D-glucosamine synthase [Mammaliicoccus fleurettii]MEB7780006.1 poly-beta-1,6-N-acetyl-D-glucosamine synthase [Mammaliicoccus fle
MELLLMFFIAYPITMSIFWIIGTLIYYIFIERRLKRKNINYHPSEGISFIIACYNEAETIADTIKNLDGLSFPLKEIIAVNDGSSDHTKEELLKLEDEYHIKFINLEENKGKANALNVAAKLAKYPYLMCVDADTIIDDDAPYYMIESLVNDASIGAVTGNPRIRNKSTLLGKIQTIEYASMIGSIKRAQTINGYVNTISGVFSLFNKKALQKNDFWDTDMITEDIAVSWKFHLSGYKIKYEPRALCWMLVPETFNGLWKQRVRWSQGGHEVILRDFKNMLKVRNVSLWLLFLEQILSVVWVYGIVVILAYTLLQLNFLDYYFYDYQLNIFLLSAFLLTFVNIIQFTLSLMIDSRYERKNNLFVIFLSWYPTFYWIINALVVIVAFPKALKRKKGEFATWTSPDRGNLKESNQD